MRIEELLAAAMVERGRSVPVWVVECDGPGDTQMPPDPTNPAEGD